MNMVMEEERPSAPPVLMKTCRPQRPASALWSRPLPVFVKPLYGVTAGHQQWWEEPDEDDDGNGDVMMVTSTLSPQRSTSSVEPPPPAGPPQSSSGFPTWTPVRPCQVSGCIVRGGGAAVSTLIHLDPSHTFAHFLLPLPPQCPAAAARR